MSFNDVVYKEKVKPYFSEIRKWIKNKKSNRVIADKLGISMTSFYRKIKEYPELQKLFNKRLRYYRYDGTSERNRGADLTYEHSIKTHFERIKQWKKEGKTNREVCVLLGVGSSTFYAKQEQYPEFKALLNTEYNAIKKEKLKLKVIVNNKEITPIPASEVKMTWKAAEDSPEVELLRNGEKTPLKTSDIINKTSKELLSPIAFIHVLTHQILQKIKNPELESLNILEQTKIVLKDYMKSEPSGWKDDKTKLELKITELVDDKVRLELKITELVDDNKKLHKELKDYKSIDDIAEQYLMQLNGNEKEEKQTK